MIQTPELQVIPGEHCGILDECEENFNENGVGNGFEQALQHILEVSIEFVQFRVP